VYPAAPDGSVIVYSAEWCGYCKKTMAWMRQNNVPFIERDVEKAAGAGAEVAAKLKAAGVPGGGIPVIDWGGTLVVGFQQDKLAALLGATPKPAQKP
jgi:glutaredoxin